MIKKILLPTGIYHYWYAKRYSYKILKVLPDLKDFWVVKYEDLVVKDDSVLLELLKLLNSKISLEELKIRMDEIKVINTSFYKEEMNSSKVWNEKNKTEKFNPISRKSMTYHKMKFIDLGVKELMNVLNYN